MDRAPGRRTWGLAEKGRLGAGNGRAHPLQSEGTNPDTFCLVHDQREAPCHPFSHGCPGNHLRDPRPGGARTHEHLPERGAPHVRGHCQLVRYVPSPCRPCHSRGCAAGCMSCRHSRCQHTGGWAAVGVMLKRDHDPAQHTDAGAPAALNGAWTYQIELKLITYRFGTTTSRLTLSLHFSVDIAGIIAQTRMAIGPAKRKFPSPSSTARRARSCHMADPKTAAVERKCAAPPQ